MNAFLCEIQTISNVYGEFISTNNLQQENFHQALGILLQSITTESTRMELLNLSPDYLLAADSVLIILKKRVKEMLREFLTLEKDTWGPRREAYDTLLITISILWNRNDATELLERLIATHNSDLDEKEKFDGIEALYPELRQIIESSLEEN